MKNNHEVEIRALLNDKDRKFIFDKLLERGGVMKSEEILEDIYWCPKATNSFEGIEMSGIGSYSLRTRKSGDGNCQLNVKVITKKDDHNAWDEHEISISSCDEAAVILGTIGFKIFFSLKKHRYSFDIKPFTVLIEDIDDFGPILEVEILTDEALAAQAKKQITDFISELGVDSSKIVPKSVTNLLMKE